MKRFKYAREIILIITAICFSAIFAVALTVYVVAEPNNVSEIIPAIEMNELKERFSEMRETLDDMETLPCVTKVYEYKTYADKLNIRYDYLPRNSEIRYSIVTDPNAEYNYRAECYVLSDIADKDIVKRLWNVSVREGDALTLTQTHVVKKPMQLTYNNIKKTEPQNDTIWYFDHYMRIIVKPGFNDIEFIQTEKNVSPI